MSASSSWFTSCVTLATSMVAVSSGTSNNNCSSSLTRQRRDHQDQRLMAQLSPQPVSSSSTPICMGMGDVAVAMILVILIITTIVGNILVVLSIAVYRRMRTFTNVLLVSLASADLLVGIMVMPIALVDQLHRHRWQFGLILCKLWTTTDVLLCTASILNLCVISLDRYFAITAPLRYTRTRSQTLAVAIVAAVWLVSLVISSPPWFVPQWTIQLEDETCGYAKATAYRIYSAFGSFYIPLLIMLFVYFKIFRVASTREKVLNAERRGSRTMQMWQQQATRRAARNSLAANAAVGAQLALNKTGSVVSSGGGIGLGSTMSSRSAPGGRAGNLRHYDNMQPTDDAPSDEYDEDDAAGSTRRVRGRVSYRGLSIDDSRRKRTQESGNSYYRHMNRGDSPATNLKHVKFANPHKLSQMSQVSDLQESDPAPPTKAARFRPRIQRTPTEEILDSELGPTWREQNTTVACSSVSDMTTGARPTSILAGQTRTSIDCALDSSQNQILGQGSNMEVRPSTTTTTIPGSSSQNNVPLLTDHARRYAEKTVPWSLVRKANEYYVNSKPLRPSREKLIYLKERKALKTIGIVVSGFIICWLPFFILYLIEAACITNEPDLPYPTPVHHQATPTPAHHHQKIVTPKIVISPKLSITNNSSRRVYHQNAYVIALASAAAAADYSTFAALSSSWTSRSSTTQSTMMIAGRSSLIQTQLLYQPSSILVDSNNDHMNSTGTNNSTAAFLICSIPPILADLFLWLGYSNSVLNPLIYTFYNRDFRRCFKDLLSGGCLRRNAANRRMSVRRLHQTRL